MKGKVLVSAEEEGGNSVSVAALPGCYTEGNTRKELLANVRETAAGWLKAGNSQEPEERPSQVVEIDR